MQAPPETNSRDPVWMWPAVALVGLLLLIALALASRQYPAWITPPNAAAGASAVDAGPVIWAGAVVTLMLYSLLYRENPIFRFAEHMFLGLAAGYGIYATWGTNLFQNWYEPVFRDGQWLWMLGFLFGILYFTVYSPRLRWMSRVVVVMLLAFDAGTYFRLFAGEWMGQIGDSFRALVTKSPPYILFSNVVFTVTLLAVMTYFLFSFEQRGKALRGTATAGRWLMMIAFGAMFGSTVMARMSLFIGRLSYLFEDWIHLIPKS